METFDVAIVGARCAGSPLAAMLARRGLRVCLLDRARFPRNAYRERNFATGLARWPQLADLLGGARRDSPIRVMTDWHAYFRRSAGPGWALVGDAGHFKDFTPAQGIADALRQATTLAESITAGLDNAAGPDPALHRWWRWRDRDAYDMYWLAEDMGDPGFPRR
jgi:menaquinone-9 beta-reductase